jgi:hypothetical protein
MAIHATCSCGARFRAKPEHAGKRAKCPSCGQSLTIPNPQPENTVDGNPLGKGNSDPLGLGNDFHADVIAKQAASSPKTPVRRGEHQQQKRSAADELLQRAAAELRERERSSTGFSLTDAKRLWTRSSQPARTIISAAVACAAIVAFIGLFVPPIGGLLIGTVGTITALAGFVGYLCLMFHAFSDDDAASGFIMLGGFVVPFLGLYVYYYMLTRWEGTIPFWLVAGSLLGMVLLLLYLMAFMLTNISFGL